MFDLSQATAFLCAKSAYCVIEDTIHSNNDNVHELTVPRMHQAHKLTTFRTCSRYIFAAEEKQNKARRKLVKASIKIWLLTYGSSVCLYNVEHLMSPCKCSSTFGIENW